MPLILDAFTPLLDLSYTIGFEANTVSVDCKPTTDTLRVTHVYRRENGEWKIVH